MSRLRKLNGVLHNFLATYTSRYSDYDGYWLFGLLVDNPGDLEIDLLSQVNNGFATPVAAAQLIAIYGFRDQMEKAGFSVSHAKEAHLYLTRLPELRRGAVNGRLSSGYNVRFSVKMLYDNAKVYERVATVFVAPHDPKIEHRSVRVK